MIKIKIVFVDVGSSCKCNCPALFRRRKKTKLNSCYVNFFIFQLVLEINSLGFLHAFENCDITMKIKVIIMYGDKNKREVWHETYDYDSSDSVV